MLEWFDFWWIICDLNNLYYIAVKACKIKDEVIYDIANSFIFLTVLLLFAVLSRKWFFLQRTSLCSCFTFLLVGPIFVLPINLFSFLEFFFGPVQIKSIIICKRLTNIEKGLIRFPIILFNVKLEHPSAVVQLFFN